MEQTYFAHETAIIDANCLIGEGTKIWHFSHIMSGCRIGKNYNIGQNVVISPEVVLGNNIKVQNNVSVYTGVTCGDDVFLGPSCVFTNVTNPRSAVNRKSQYAKTQVGKGATIGANIKMGNIYSQQRVPELAIEQYKLAIEHFMRTGNAYNCIGRCLVDLQRYEEAEENLLHSLKLSSTSYSIKNIYLGLFQLYTLQDNRTLAKADAIKQTLDTLFRHEQLISTSHYNEYHLTSAHYYRKKGNLEKALSHINQVTNPLSKLSEEAHIYALKGNYKQVYKNLEERHLLADSLRNQKNTALLASYNARFHNQNLELKRNQLRLQNTEISTRLQKRMLLGIIIFLVLASVFSIVYALSYRKMSHRLRIERNAAEKARLQAEKADRLKTVFLQNLSHEIRTPLNAILGFNEVLNNEEMELSAGERKQMLEMLESNGSLLLQMINQSVDLSCLDSGNLEVSKTATPVNDLCHQVIKKAEKNLPEGVKLELQEPQEEIQLTSDARHLERILTHLLNNACKYTRQGNISLTYTSNAKQVIFTVTDTGCGIAPEDAEKIFQRFEKLDHFKPDAGLGLSICRGIRITGWTALSRHHLHQRCPLYIRTSAIISSAHRNALP